jgi:Leucine rich repeat
MSHDNKKLPKTNSLLPSFNYKQFISLVILLLVTSPSTQTPSVEYECPSSCVCDTAKLSARCDNIESLIASYNKKHHGNHLMPIKSLDLSKNQLTKVSNQLEVLVNLTDLNLSHNRLTQVHKLNFEHLEKLDLSHNRITSAKLSKLPKNVIHLNLTHNEITYLPVDFMKLKKLRTLELFENPLNCTCDTLMVRNWISYQHVWSSNVIKCLSPQIFKGQPWLQAKQNDICIEPSSTTTQRSNSKYNFDNYDENDVMMGDQPASDDDTDAVKDDVEYDSEYAEADSDIFDVEDKKEEKSENDEDENKEKDEIEQDFIAVHHEEHASSVAPETNVSPKEGDENENDEEGSGLSASPEPMIVEEVTEDDGSGSGDGIALIFTSEASIPSLGIFEEDESTTLAPVLQKGAVAGSNKETETVPTETTNSDKLGGLTSKASTEDNTGTYVLLGIIAILLVSLIVFVAMKNRKEKNRNRRMYDVEKNGATELQDMDKRLLGKPLERNGNGNGKAEHAPLMNDKHDDGYARYPKITVDEPVQEVPMQVEKSQPLAQSAPEHIEPVHSPKNGDIHGPKPGVDSDEEVFHPASDTPVDPESQLSVSPEPPKRYSPIYTPISPRSARYSPVYEPETGRVKIKLSETPKPKTPTFVTRSRSNAGDYVNTPN